MNERAAEQVQADPTLTGPQPVKIVIERRALPGCKQGLEAWIGELVQSAARTSHLQGSSVLTHGEDYFVLLRFASQAALDAWQAAPEVTELLARAEALGGARPRTHVRTGLETWFEVPGLPPPPHAPPRWKMALVTWVMLMPLVWAMGRIVPGEWPLPLRLAVSTLVPVCLLTWVVMPNATRLLYRWLYQPTSVR